LAKTVGDDIFSPFSLLLTVTIKAKVRREIEEAATRRITVSSSVNEISPDQLEQGGGEWGQGYYDPTPCHPFL
jgi:hypothetical protein